MSDSAPTSAPTCSCGNPILLWVHNLPPNPCGEVIEAPKPNTIASIRDALVKHLDSFIGKTTAPETVDQIKAQLRTFFLEQKIDIDEHFDIVAVGKDDINITAKTDWAREFLAKSDELGLETEVVDLPALRKKMNEALRTALGTFYLKKNTPFTRFQIAARLRPLLIVALDMTEKQFADHFDIAVTPRGIDVLPKTEWAKTLLSEN